MSDCRSLMEPVGTWFRRNGEQVVVHRCLGCGAIRNCRVAADDYHVACMKLDLGSKATVDSLATDSGGEMSA